jgi:hypothetical protein
LISLLTTSSRSVGGLKEAIVELVVGIGEVAVGHGTLLSPFGY